MADDALFVVLLLLICLVVLSVFWAIGRAIWRMFWSHDAEPAGRDSNTFRR